MALHRIFNYYIPHVFFHDEEHDTWQDYTPSPQSLQLSNEKKPQRGCLVFFLGVGVKNSYPGIFRDDFKKPLEPRIPIFYNQDDSWHHHRPSLEVLNVLLQGIMISCAEARNEQKVRGK